MTNHLAKNHKISDLFRHLQVGQTECRKRRIWVGRVKLYISALRLEDGELLLVVSQLIFNIFSFDKVQLTLDRTNWKWGKRDINILMLAIVYRGIAIPIVWTLLNKRGNSDTKERIALIQRFISIFGKDRIVNVFADREFIGEKWFTWLIENDINFCIREIGRASCRERVCLYV